jgi:isopropylmalate/homocitrate/citramalate synthase
VKVSVCDVGPRDGLQIEDARLDPATRAELARRLFVAGVARVEIGSFVDSRRVPQMAGAEEVAERLGPGGAWSALVLNERGYARLAATPVRRANFAFAVTDEYNGRNQGATSAESVALLGRICELAGGDGRSVTATVAVAFGCPFAGTVPERDVLDAAERAVAAGASEVVLADTIGVAVPSQVRRLVSAACRLGVPVGAHLHNTRSTGYANALAAVEAGAELLDAAVGGTGGCPFAPRATGNIATEDLAYLLRGEGIDTGIDIDAMIGVAAWLEELLGHSLPGQLHRAGDFAPAVVAA